MAFEFLGDALSGVGNALFGTPAVGPTPTGEALQNRVGGVAGFIEEHPDQFAFIADTIGQALDPQNPFAGAGTKIAQSRIASKAAGERSTQMDELIKVLSGIISDPDNPISGITKSGSDGGLKLTLDALGGPIQAPTSNLDEIRKRAGQ